MPSIPRISDAEWAVMEVVWEDPPVTARKVHEALSDERDWTLRTVKTLLARLLDKGALRHEVDGKSYLYSPAISPRPERSGGEPVVPRARAPRRGQPSARELPA